MKGNRINRTLKLIEDVTQTSKQRRSSSRFTSARRPTNKNTTIEERGESESSRSDRFIGAGLIGAGLEDILNDIPDGGSENLDEVQLELYSQSNKSMAHSLTQQSKGRSHQS